MLIEAKLAPSKINVRLFALKSLVDYARKMGECAFSLNDVPGLKTENYRDTTGIDAESFKSVIKLADVNTVSGAIVIDKTMQFHYFGDRVYPIS